MDFWKKLTGELIDIVEFLDNSQNTLVHRFERHNNEIKNGAKLVVREGQAAVFVNEGELADVFTPGTYTLATANLPILATLKGWKYGFNSPFKAEVYFVATRQFTDIKWGTMNPVIRRDPEFGPVRLRAFGTYALRVKDPAAIIRELAGTAGRFTIEGVMEQLRNLIVSRFSEAVGESSVPLLDIAGHASELSDAVAKIVRPEFEALGIDLTKLLVENVSLPPEVEAALDKRSSMGIVGAAPGGMNQFTQFQAASAMEAAAKNPGAAGGAAAMGMGFVVAQQMGQSMQAAQQGAQPAPAAPPPLPAAVAFYVGVNGQQAGPFDLATLTAQAHAGQLSRDALVWKPGMPAWTPAAQVPDLAPLFPPPMPPAVPGTAR
ncbi:MAG: SPFH domain-containing protein [Phycisphaerae bacterium]|nr:SPFH domain-containing protein [Phycisphaerae bacterium]